MEYLRGKKRSFSIKTFIHVGFLAKVQDLLVNLMSCLNSLFKQLAFSSFISFKEYSYKTSVEFFSKAFSRFSSVSSKDTGPFQRLLYLSFGFFSRSSDFFKESAIPIEGLVRVSSLSKEGSIEAVKRETLRRNTKFLHEKKNILNF